ncbi:MAG TPA: FkbM family methyltransferase [Gemmataceae bacterium]|nr:FkbM family methyltransferase [Gemmataceae bacterium]
MQQTKLLTGAFNHLGKCRHGFMLYNINDVYIGRSFDLYGEFSEGEVELFDQIVRVGDVVLDVGANIGAHTLALAQKVGPTGRVYAFEPQRMVFQTLCANMALNSIANTYCHQTALGEEAGSVVVPALNYAQANNFGGVELGTFASGESVPVSTLDSLDLPACRLVKIDVEGMEGNVLKGAVQTVKRLKPILYVENDRVEKSIPLMQLIESLGYEMYWHLPPLYHPQNFYRNPQNVFGNIVSANLLCVHRELGMKITGFKQALSGERHPFAPQPG